jgi:hypothetical protein
LKFTDVPLISVVDATSVIKSGASHKVGVGNTQLQLIPGFWS